MEKVVLNIPHSSLVIPKWAASDMIISPDELSSLAQFMVDKDVDQLWEFVPEANKQVATVSRLVVDAERYRCDNEEPMASLGMGLYYTHTPEGKCFRLKSERAYRKCLEIYDEYHGAFEKKVSDCLQANGSCIILDCHSFHDAMEYTGFCSEDFPDVCIGVNGIITEEARYVSEVFRQFGYSVEINRPFSGALVPLRFLEDERVTSIMIELNRRIYDNAAFGAVQNLCRQIYRCLCERRKNGINEN